MSYALDVNLLLYASNQRSPFFESAREFLERCVSEPELLCLPWPILMSYLRIATHPRIFTAPLSPEMACSNIESLIELPHARVLSEGDNFWSCYRRATEHLSVRSNLVPDAHLVALLMEHGVSVLYTHDTDFRKFDCIEARDPIVFSG